MNRAASILAIIIAAGGCTPYGGGYYYDDDDDGGELMTLTVYMENNTGYDIIAVGTGVNERAELEATDGVWTTGSWSSATQTFDNVTYGTQFHVESIAMDTDGDCYDWESGGRDYNFGPELTVEIIFDFGHLLGGCP